MQPLGDPPIHQLIGETMREHELALLVVAAINPHHTIATGVLRARPSPTFARLVYAFPEVRDVLLSSSSRYTCFLLQSPAFSTRKFRINEPQP
jgi:hypothetical protein